MYFNGRKKQSVKIIHHNKTFYSLAKYTAKTSKTTSVGYETRVRNGHSFKARKSSRRARR